MPRHQSSSPVPLSKSMRDPVSGYRMLTVATDQMVPPRPRAQQGRKWRMERLRMPRWLMSRKMARIPNSRHKSQAKPHRKTQTKQPAKRPLPKDVRQVAKIRHLGKPPITKAVEVTLSRDPLPVLPKQPLKVLNSGDKRIFQSHPTQTEHQAGAKHHVPNSIHRLIPTEMIGGCHLGPIF